MAIFTFNRQIPNLFRISLFNISLQIIFTTHFIICFPQFICHLCIFCEKLVRLCINTNYFSFKEEFYRQKFGCSMGGNLSPILANLYMEYFETVLLPRIKPRDMIWYRYVDDIFSVWNDAWGSFDIFFQQLNSFVPSIKFKVEWE